MVSVERTFVIEMAGMRRVHRSLLRGTELDCMVHYEGQPSTMGIGNKSCSDSSNRVAGSDNGISRTAAKEALAGTSGIHNRWEEKEKYFV